MGGNAREGSGGGSPGGPQAPGRDLLAKAVAAAVLVGGLNAMVQLIRLVLHL